MEDEQLTNDESQDRLLKIYLSGILPYLGVPGIDGKPPIEGVAEVMINRHDDIWIERHGQLMRVPETVEAQCLENLAVMLAKITRNTGGEGSILTVYRWGLRIAIAMSPTSWMGTSMSIRRKVQVHVPLENYARNAVFGVPDEIPDPTTREELMEWLRLVVSKRKTIIVSGGTSSGKTTFLNALLSCIPEEERVLTIEDSPELEPVAPNLVRLVVSETLGITTRDLIRLALRFRPDRIIIGEVRGAEALDMLDACNTGHDGSLTSIHANNPLQALERLETLVLRAGVDWPHAAIRQTIGSTIHYVIQMRKNRDGHRVISNILALEGVREDGSYRFRNIHIDNNASQPSTTPVMEVAAPCLLSA